MTIRKLHFSAPTFVGSVLRSCDTSTHDIRIGGPGYIVTERRGGKSFLVHAGACTAELEADADDIEDAAAPAVPVQGRGKAAQGKATIPPG